MHFPSRTHLALAGRARLFVAVGIAAALVASSGLAQAQPVSPQTLADCSTLHFTLANPAAGDTLQPGGYVVEGFAFDAAATTQQGIGVDRVEIFLNDRDTGGLSLGTADLGAPSTVVVPSSQFGLAGFRVDVLLPTQPGGHTLFAYAHSTVTDQEQVLSVPIQVGTESGAEAMLDNAVPTTGTMLCPPAASTQATIATTPAAIASTPIVTTPAAVASTPATIQATPQAAAAVTQAPPAAPLQLALSNPQPGDNLQSGAYTIAGTAVDSRATQGSGVDRIEIFLGDRDQGGLYLGQAAVQESSPDMSSFGSFSIEVDLPDQLAGRTLFAYAYSSVADDVAVIGIPVTVGTIAD